MYDNLSICKIRHDRCLAFYNGSVSSMTWVMTGDATVRGYKYTYNDYGWLTAATYGEGLAVSANKDRYSEKISGFTRNGSITGFQRHGNMASSNFGKIDDLTITYSGNRISTVKDASLPVTQNGSMDYPGGSTPKSFEYNAFGAIVKDESRGITAVTYDNFGNPLSTMFSSGVGMKNVYSATGEKLKTLTITNATRQADAAIAFEPEMDMLSLDDSAAASGVMAQSTTEYHGPIIYRDGKVDMVLFPGGYATVNGSAVTFHYYTQDYLGNNRAVINGSTGAIEQTVAYYPYGGVIIGLGTPTTGQPYKFGGKELITANGLNEYDFGARWYYSTVPSFTKPDPMAEKYPWLSPYLYCANNPVNYVDPDGRDVYVWATMLPGAPRILSFATHTFITVTTDKGKTEYFAYGSEIDGISGAVTGRLCRREYNQDKRIYSGKSNDNSLLKAKIFVNVPEGMTQEEFDQKVIDVAESFGNVDGIRYNMLPIEKTEGNCNTSTSTILIKSGVSEDQLKEIDRKIPLIDAGFGTVKPWTKDEQERVVEDQNRRYEALEKALP